MFPGAVTPFQSPFDPSEIVSIGAGGSLTLGFDNPIQDRNDSFGIDFIVFGNTIYLDASFPNGVVGGTLAEPGTIEVSQDGVVWQQVAAQADTPFPTLGYQDLSEPYPTEPGQIPTNFHHLWIQAWIQPGWTSPSCGRLRWVRRRNRRRYFQYRLGLDFLCPDQQPTPVVQWDHARN